LRGSAGSFATFAAMRRASSRVSSLAADRRPTSEPIRTMHKSWKPSECDESGLHRLVGDFVSEDLFIGLIKVFVAIVHRVGPFVRAELLLAGKEINVTQFLPGAVRVKVSEVIGWLTEFVLNGDGPE